MAETPIQIRTLVNSDEYHVMEQLQATIWASGQTDVIPLPLLLTIQKNGGLVAGAFDDEGNMIGLVMGFLGFRNGTYRHCSHIAGVLPNLRRKNVGYELKLFQRDYVLKQGLDLITWTYDPLESVNANLNINKLGCINQSYYENHYGYWDDGLNAGIPTDRFEVEWWIKSERVQQTLSGTYKRPSYAELMNAGVKSILTTSIDGNGIVHPGQVELALEGDALLIEIPAEFQMIKKFSMDLAATWRYQTRTIFQTYLKRGYVVADLILHREGDLRRNFYLLRQQVEGLPR